MLFEDLLFGGFSGARGGRRSQRPKCEDITYPMNVTLEDVFHGRTKKLKLTKRGLCKDCDGTGSESRESHECRTCNGVGMRRVIRQMGPIIQEGAAPCTDCNGRGTKVPEADRCKACEGSRVTPTTKLLEVHIEKGIRDNQKIVFEGQGDQTSKDEDPGDVIVVVQVKDHPTFKRQGDDLVIEKEISLNEALCGWRCVIEHVDGKTHILETKRGEVVKPDAVKAVRGLGLPRSKDPKFRGSLYIKFTVRFPEQYFFNDEKKYKELEAVLPPAKKQKKPLEECEEVSLMEFNERKYQRGGRGGTEAYNEDSDDEDGGLPSGFPRGGGVQCAQQ